MFKNIHWGSSTIAVQSRFAQATNRDFLDANEMGTSTFCYNIYTILHHFEEGTINVWVSLLMSYNGSGFNTCLFTTYLTSFSSIFSASFVKLIVQAQKPFSIFFVRLCRNKLFQFSFSKRACESPWNLIIIKTTKCDEQEKWLKVKVLYQPR